MAYLKSHGSPGCIFCGALGASDPREGLVVHTGSGNFVLLNRFPYTNGHLMIAPMAHVATLNGLAPSGRMEIMDLIVRAQEVLGALYAPGGFNIGMNLGACAGAGIADHLHVHVVPRWEGDTNFMSVMAETRMVPEDMDVTWRRIREAFGGKT
jgi:ATP adenylyltransferase